MSYYPLYGNVFVDSPNTGTLGGTLSITNSGNSRTLGNEASIAFGIVDVSYGILGRGLIESGVDTADARISAVIDTVTPNVGTAMTFKISGNSQLPPTESMRISSSGNIGIGISQPVYALDVSNSGIRSTSILSNGIKSTSVVAFSNPTNVDGSDFVIGEGASSSATSVYGQNNIFIGNPPKTLTTTATYNVAVGNQSLTSLTTGGNNVAVGYKAGNAITTGSQNTYIGYQSGNTSTTAAYCTAIGYQSLLNNTTGNFNTACGTNSLAANDTGINNVAIGGNALLNLKGSNNNTAIGTNTMFNATSGLYNTCVGYGSFELGTNIGEYNTAIGFNAFRTTTTYNNSTAIGYNALPTASNQIVLGTSTETVIVRGNLDITGNTTTSGDTITNAMVEKYSTGPTVSSNAFTVPYSTMSNIMTITPSSATNMTLNIMGLPTTRGSAIYDFTFIINTTANKQYINTLNVNGTGAPMKYANGSANTAVNSSATVVLQTISIQMSDTSIINAFTNVTSYF